MGRHDARVEPRRRSRSRSPVKTHKKRKNRSRSRSYSRERDVSRHRKKSRSRSRESSKRKSSHKKHKKRDHKKKKSKKRRDHSSTSSSQSSDDDDGASSDSSMELLEKLERERRELVKKRKDQKERMKALETPEEKRARRLAKKAAKARNDREKMGWDKEYLHYTNEDNPYGDSNLTSTFRWQKKLEKDGIDKVDDHELQKMQRAKFEEQKRELEKVKQRRLDREREREERQALLELEDRQRENDKFSKWQHDEDQFHLKQAHLRSNIRIVDGRAKPIDLLAKYISAEEEMDAVEMHEPYTYLNGLTVSDLEDLLVDINVYEKIDLDRNKEFWTDIVTIVNDELHKLRKLDAGKSQYEEAAERRQGINKAVASDVQDVFKGKTSDQLSQLQVQIERKLSQRTEGVDVGYWESLLSQLKAHLARARLRDKHSESLRRKLELLKNEQGIGSPDQDQEAMEDEEVKEEDFEIDDHVENQEEIKTDSADETTVDNTPLLDYATGSYSPQYLSQEDLEPGTIVMTDKEEENKREMDQRAASKGSRVDNVMNAEEKALERKAKEGMNPDEEASFAVESALNQTYEWSDKYRPRKPRYFNRVHTGFEWNKYNQTHYDVDNPPPKVVQGYKFNIFYPDLIDKTSTPQYTLTPCPDNSDFCILRIHAGPPYEDIAFKIVNREWEYGYKRGFRCQFQNNIFQLWFHFKRLRYRR